MKKLSDIGEFGLISWIKKHSPGNAFVVKGIGDDAAVLKMPSSDRLLYTTDMLVEDVHFTKKMPALDVGHKAIAVNVSDVAAMGGLPCYAVVSLGVAAKSSLEYVQDIYKGIFKAAKKYDCAIVGGDTVKSEKIIINVAMIGRVNQKDVVLRSGAKVGEEIFVTGRLGKSLESGRHLTFTPRIKESQFLVKNFNPTSMIDISDGLAADLGHILEESHVGAVLEEKKIPLNKTAELKHALYDGEDFELLFTVPSKQADKLENLTKPHRFFHIGKINSRAYNLQLQKTDGALQKLALKGYKHF